MDNHGLKVLMVASDPLIFTEGSAVRQRIEEYGRKLKELHVITFNLNNSIPRAASRQISNNIFLHPTNSISKINYVFDGIRIGKKLIKKEGFSSSSAVITTQDPFEAGLVGYILKRKFRIHLQVQIHTDFLSPYFRNSLLNWVRVMLSKFIIPKADSIRVVSSVISDSIRSNFPNLNAKLDVLPIFVDINQLLQAKPVSTFEKPFPFTILMASRISNEKRIDVALSAFKKMMDKLNRHDIGLSIIGRGNTKKIKRIIDSLEIDKNVTISEWSDNIGQYYQNSDIFLLTSDFEGYGMTLIEAGASGCPIVTTKVGVAQIEPFKDGINSYICPVGDVDCLSSRLADLVNNNEKRELFGQKMRDSLSGMAISREEYVKRYVDLLENARK